MAASDQEQGRDRAAAALPALAMDEDFPSHPEMLQERRPRPCPGLREGLARRLEIADRQMVPRHPARLDLRAEPVHAEPGKLLPLHH
ncbi:MAG: hypothetical protein M0002_20950 [Rhodospirillales bacterium]|nr:hypothetical protein [Rhodospirillales bacterium]